MRITPGSTDVITYFNLRATGLTITDFDLQYTRSGAAPAAKVDATALATTDAAHADNKAIEVDSSSSQGLYRVDWPDAAFAAGVSEVILSVTCGVYYEQKTVTLEAAPANDGDPMTLAADQAVNVSKWGGQAIVAGVNGVPTVDITHIHGTALTETDGQLAAGFKKVFDVATPVFTAENVNQTGDVYAALPTNFSDLAIEETTGAVTLTAAERLQSENIAIRIKHGIKPDKALYYIAPAAAGGNDGNDGLTRLTPKLEPGNIAIADGDGVCVMGICPITVAFNPSTVAKINVKLFGFGIGVSRLTSTTLTYDFESTPPVGQPMVRLNSGCRVEGLQIAGNAAGVIPLAQSSVGAIYDCVVKRCTIIGNQVAFAQRETEDIEGHVYENRFEDVLFRAVNPVYLISGNGLSRFVQCTMRTGPTTAATGDAKHASIRVGKVDSNNWGGRIILDRCHLNSQLNSATEMAYGIYVGAMYATTSTANGDVGYGRILANGCTFKVYNPLAGGAADIQNDDTAARTKVIIGTGDGPLVTAGTGDIRFADPVSATTIDANIVSISDDTDAADNLEKAFDGTGYVSQLTVKNVTDDPFAEAP